jgi:hypothetical protein
LNLSNFALSRVRSIALRNIFCSSRPKTLSPISEAMRKNAHPALRISSSNAHTSESVTVFQPGTQDSLVNARSVGNNALSLIRMVPVLNLIARSSVLSAYSELGRLLGLRCFGGRQTASSHRTIRRRSALDTMGSKIHEQRRSGNPFTIVLPIGHPVLVVAFDSVEALPQAAISDVAQHKLGPERKCGCRSCAGRNGTRSR